MEIILEILGWIGIRKYKNIVYYIFRLKEKHMIMSIGPEKIVV